MGVGVWGGMVETHDPPQKVWNWMNPKEKLKGILGDPRQVQRVIAHVEVLRA